MSFIDKYASEHYVQAHMYGYNFYQFGNTVCTVKPSIFEFNWPMGLGPDGQGIVNAEKSATWEDEPQEFSVALNRVMLDGPAQILDDEIIQFYEYVDRLLMTGRQDMPTAMHPERHNFDAGMFGKKM